MSDIDNNNLLNKEDDDDDDEDYKPEREDSASDVPSEESDYDEFDCGTSKKPKNKKQTSQNSNEQVTGEKVEKISEEEQKKKSDDLWAEFCKDLPESSKPKQNVSSESSDNKTNELNGNKNPVSKVKKVYDFAGETITVEEEIHVKNEKSMIIN